MSALQTFKIVSSNSTKNICQVQRIQWENNKNTGELFCVSREPQLPHLYNGDKYIL